MAKPTEKQIVAYLEELAAVYAQSAVFYNAKLTDEPLSSSRWINGMAAARGGELALDQALAFIKDGTRVDREAPVQSTTLSTPEQDAATVAKFEEKVKSE